MTSALRTLIEAHHEDRDFPYMDFIGAFLLVEKWIARSGDETMHRIDTANLDDFLGLPLGDSEDDIKLGYVLGLLRNHAQEVYQHFFRSETPLLH